MKFLLAIFILLILTFFWWTNQLQPVSSVSSEVSFVIVKNESAASVVYKLKSQNLIRSPLVAKIYLKLTSQDTSLRPGGYILSPDQTTPHLLRQLTLGPKDVWVTVPEGWRREQIAARLAQTLSGPDSRFDPVEFITQTATLEGQLFPDTYLLPRSAATSDIISLFTANFARKSGLNLPADYPTLIISSLVEREAKSEPERRLIAGILIKRLSSGWALQVDATVQYAFDGFHCQKAPLVCDWWRPAVDTRFRSPYNTYLAPGLPPAPIANPGLAAISAVLGPTASPYWYYLTDHQGTTHYSTTLPEHNLNVDKYLRL